MRMLHAPPNLRSLWYRSFYWRIGLSFVVFVVAVIVAESVIFSFRMQRADRGNPGFSPNNQATTVAAEVGSALTADPRLDLGTYLRRRYNRTPFRMFVVMKDGRVAANSDQPLSEEIRRSAAQSLAGVPSTASGSPPRIAGPVVMAPILVSNVLAGLVVMPPPPPGGVVRDVGRLLSLPGTLLLVIGTVVAAVVIFAPARRRLRALEDAALRLGAGDLGARAQDRGGDEIASVARAFNHMAAELADRDAALRMSDKLRRQMLADVSHELRTPLTTMRGYLETLHMPELAVDSATRERYLDTVERETRRLDRIVSDLMDLARYENGVVDLDRRMFSVERLFGQVIRRHERDLALRRIVIRTGVADAADQIFADPDRLEQVVENLVANAIRHTPAGGSIELQAAANRGMVYLTVVDSGHGIPPAHLAHVFDRFYKADKARAAASGGSGLGLSIAKAIVEQHGGTIGVTSVPGRTEFTVAIPNP
jgi:signal transduction histidine kinase